MRTRNPVERLAAAGRPLLAEAVALVDASEENRILELIFASDRRVAVVHRRWRPVLVFALGAVVAAAIAVVSTGTFQSSNRAGGRHRVALTGPKIEVAGFHFRTPAGFSASTSSCLSRPVPGRPRPAIDGFAAAASADGGCLEAAYLLADQSLHGPADAQPIDVGQYQGYFVPQTRGPAGQSSLFVDLPKAGGGQLKVSLLLLSQGLTEDQLIAVAESGLPTLPPAGPTSTTGTETTG